MTAIYPALSKSLVAALSERIHVSLPVYPEVIMLYLTLIGETYYTLAGPRESHLPIWRGAGSERDVVRAENSLKNGRPEADHAQFGTHKHQDDEFVSSLLIDHCA